MGSRNVYVPVKGEIIDITKVNDSVFSEKMAGDGMAIIPNDSNVCAPIDGVVKSIFPTNHAFIISNELGDSLLIHIGLETMELDDIAFTRIASEGSSVKKGDVIIRSDYQTIIKHDCDPVVLVILLENEITTKSKEGSNNRIDHVLFTIQ